MVSDSERMHAIKLLTDLYAPGDFQVAKMKMPSEKSDSSGENFGKYFDFLQALFLLRGMFMSMEEAEIRESVIMLKNAAERFGYPTNQLEVL